MVLKTPPIFRHPSKIIKPSIEMEKRFRLENLKAVNRHNLKPEIDLFLTNLIKSETYSLSFPLSKLDGFLSSKSKNLNGMSNLAEFGSSIVIKEGDQTLKDLIGLRGKELIEAASRWEGILDGVIEIETDSWHDRFYWSNSGGSHHMSVLCRELVNNGIEIEQPASLLRYSIDMLEVLKMKEMYGIFIVNHDLPLLTLSTVDNITHLYRIMDITVVSMNLNSFDYPTYNLIFIPKSNKLSSIALEAFENYCKEGYAMRFDSFLKAF